MIEKAQVRRISAANYLEAAVVMDNRGDPLASGDLDLFFRRAGIVVETVTFEHARIARLAFRDFGKPRHPAGLNFGDCFSYALSKALDEPLLFKGGDFAQTDVEPAA